tara:strand:- start:70 stop:294 length:225 start_codon:yes stop_codon:yes gene_type:complete
MDKPKNFKELKQRLLPFINYEQSIQLNKESKVQNVGNMISSHIKILEENSGNKGYMPYYDRLVILLTALEAGWE